MKDLNVRRTGRGTKKKQNTFQSCYAGSGLARDIRKWYNVTEEKHYSYPIGTGRCTGYGLTAAGSLGEKLKTACGKCGGDKQASDEIGQIVR